MKIAKSTIKGYQKRIDDEISRAEKNSEGKQKERNDKITQMKEEVAALKAQKDDAEAARREHDERARELQHAGNLAQTEQRVLQEKIVSLDAQISQCRAQQNNSLAPYGNRLREVLNEIGSRNWRGEIPVGPFGQHVKVKDMRYANVLRSYLGNAMSSFAVTNADDRRQLKEILDKYNK